MSYCRWSSDDFKSDVYTYEHVDGSWTTHVAGRRRVGLEALPESPYKVENLKRPDWQDLYRAYHEKLQSLPFEEIDLPHVGETFKDSSPQECADTLRMLKGLGYHVPDGVIEALDEEQAEASALPQAQEKT